MREQRRQEQISQRKKKVVKGTLLMFGIIAAFCFMGYSLVQRHNRTAYVLSYVPGNTSQQANVVSSSCSSTFELPPKAKLSLPLLQAQYRSLKSNLSQSFSPPKYLWLFLPQTPLSQIQQQNIKLLFAYAQKTKHQVRIVTRNNYSEYFAGDKIGTIENTIYRLQKRKEVFYMKGENQIYVRMVIVLALLQEYGGVYIEETFTMTQSLKWLQDIHKQVYVNQVDKQMPPQFFAFHNVILSSNLTKPKLNGVPLSTYSRIYPSIQSSFLATYRRSPFISSLYSTFLHLLSLQSLQSHPLLLTLRTSHSSPIYDYDSSRRGKLLNIAAFIVMKEKQDQIDKIGEGKAGMYALDWFGIKTINTNYFGEKIGFMFDHRTVQNTFYYLARISLQELEIITGKLRYVARIAPFEEFNVMLQQGRKGNKMYQIYKQSFLGQVFQDEPWVHSSPMDYSLVPKGEQWRSLPRILWVFWGTGISNSSITYQLCTRNIRDYAQMSNFTYHQVNTNNLHKYLSNQTIQTIETTLQNSPHHIYQQTFSDFVRLALLKQHGGLYLDSSFVLLQDLTWLLNIFKQPHHLIYNRYGTHPKVFMLFNAQYANQIRKTKIDQEYNTWKQWHLSYQNNFIAAQAKNQFIQAWFQEFILYHRMSHSQIRDRLIQCGLENNMWTSAKWGYLYQMDAVKCVIGRKEKQIKQQIKLQNGVLQYDQAASASQYYQIWSMNGYNGVQKLRHFTNFQHPQGQLNYFYLFFNKEYIDRVVGYPDKMTKFFGAASRELTYHLAIQPQGIEMDSLVGTYLLKYRKWSQVVDNTGSRPLLVDKYEVE